MSIPSLKRPRTTSQPPSPTASSSPKRAASEDDFASSSDNGQQDATFLTTMHQPVAPGSSPLRQESEADESGWVKRTEDVHIGEGQEHQDGTAVQDESFAERYGQLLGCLPPPFELYKRYYIVPNEALDAIKVQASVGAGSRGRAGDGTVNRLDLSKLILEPAGERVYTIATEVDSSGRTVLGDKGSEETLWRVQPGLVEDEDFKFVSEQGWKLLLDWFGPYEGPSLGLFCSQPDRLEMVPAVFTIHIVERARAGPQIPQAPSDQSSKPIRITCPSTTKLSTFVAFVQSAIADHLDADAAVRVWQLEVGDEPSTLTSLSSLRLPATLLPSLAAGLLKDNNLDVAELGLVDGDTLAVEIGKKLPIGGETWVVDVNADGKAVEKAIPSMTVPTAPAPLFSKPAFFGGNGASSAASTSSGSGVQTRSQTRTEKRNTKGLVGLVNLGNTCFMNSAVQCLSNTPELNEYFLSGVYREELNPDNPLGMGGLIAQAFGQTIETLWTGEAGSFAPRDLKFKTGRFAPQFVGYGQHDTQEFIAFLLDGLHEDLNRIQKKPYIEKPDWKPGGGDKELAQLGKECWEGYKKRNDSVIVDLFQGQLKSTLVCPECSKESITLDPFMYLTVPLPIAQTRVAKFHFVPLDPAQPPVQVKLLLPTNASWGHLKEKLATLTGCSSSNLLGIDLWQGGVYRWWRDPDIASEVTTSDVPVFYELAASVVVNRKAVGIPATETTITVPVYTFRSTEAARSRYGRSPDPSNDLQPFFITLTKAEASDPVAVREAITRGYSRWVKADARDDLWVHSGSRRAARALPAADEEDEDSEPVAEIHLDGDETRVVEVPPRSAELDVDSSQTTDSTYLSSPQPQRNASFASLSDAASMRSHKSGKMVPRGDLFKVHVADASTSEDNSGLSLSGTFSKSKEPPVAPLWRGSAKNASGSWSRLENRKKQKKGMFGHLRSMVSSSMQSDDEASPPATPTSAPLCVRPGEGLLCEWKQEAFEEFFEMEDMTKVELSTVEDPAIAKEQEKRKAGRHISLDDCLDEFSKEETLGQDDLWYCPQCKKHQAATKKLEIYQAPDILVICLKRFGSSRRLTDKLDQLVSFPMEGLDLSDRIDERKIARSLDLNSEDMAHYGFQSGDEPMIYDLYAVDNHFGGLGGGHYTAFCRNKVDGQWYNYDDSRVSKASPDAVESRAAYLLFYRRRTSRPIGGVSRVKAEEASRAASRVPSPAPSSPDLSSAEAGPSSRPLARESSGSTSSTDAMGSTEDGPGRWSPMRPVDSELPAYSASSSSPPSPTRPSPAVSDDGRASPIQPVNYDAIGAQIGFGNNAWGASSQSGATGVHHSFATTDTTGTAGTDTFVERPSMLQPTPPDSDDGFERIRKQPEPASGGSDEDYDMVRKDEGFAPSSVPGNTQTGAGIGQDDVSMEGEGTAAGDPL